MNEKKVEYKVNQGEIRNEVGISIEITTTLERVAAIMEWLQGMAQDGSIDSFTLTCNWSEAGIPI